VAKLEFDGVCFEMNSKSKNQKAEIVGVGFIRQFKYKKQNCSIDPETTSG
jgi:hypothetical protein